MEEIPLAKGKRCYTINGFSLHANTSTKPMQRDSLEKLIEYIARGPISNERLEIVGDFKDKKVRLQLKTPYSDGTIHLLLSFSKFIEKLVALIPPPRAHLVRCGGVLAANSPLRKMIVLKPKVKKALQFADFEDDNQKIQKNYSWSRMLAKAFKIAVTNCHCGGKLRIGFTQLVLVPSGGTHASLNIPATHLSAYFLASSAGSNVFRITNFATLLRLARPIRVFISS